MGIAGSLTPDQLEFFHSQGYLVIESFASEDEIRGLRKRMDELLYHFDCSVSSIFSTKNQKQTTDNYFFESAQKISFFFEEKAFGDDGELKQPKELSINKVGHALHELDPLYREFTYSSKFSSLVSSLGYKRPVVMQSMYIFKQPGIGGEVVPHQDNSFVYTDPQSCTGLWIALEDSTTVNGCLWAIPGSHKNGLVRRFIRGENGVTFDQPSPSYEQKDFVHIEMKAGSLIAIHGDLIHQRCCHQHIQEESRAAKRFDSSTLNALAVPCSSAASLLFPFLFLSSGAGAVAADDRCRGLGLMGCVLLFAWPNSFLFGKPVSFCFAERRVKDSIS